MLLDRLLRLREAAGAVGTVIEVLVLKSIALQALGELDQACATLGQALALAEPEGYVRTFVDEGPPIARLLQQAAARGIAVDYSGKLLAVLELGTKDEQPQPSWGKASKGRGAVTASRPLIFVQ